MPPDGHKTVTNITAPMVAIIPTINSIESRVIAVRLRMGDELHPDHAAGAGASLDEELLAERA